MTDSPSIRFDRGELITIDHPRYTARVVTDNGRTLRVQLWAPRLNAWHFTVETPRAWVREFDPSLSPIPSDHTAERSAA